MNEIELQGMNNLEITPAMRKYANKKLEKAAEHTQQYISNIRANLSHENHTATNLIEVIVFLHGGKTIRNQTRSEDMYASIDIACSSLERQLRKYKEKQIALQRSRSLQDKIIATEDMPQAV
jgi:putative sigma-54 modulation protein